MVPGNESLKLEVEWKRGHVTERREQLLPECGKCDAVELIQRSARASLQVAGGMTNEREPNVHERQRSHIAIRECHGIAGGLSIIVVRGAVTGEQAIEPFGPCRRRIMRDAGIAERCK